MRRLFLLLPIVCVLLGSTLLAFSISLTQHATAQAGPRLAATCKDIPAKPNYLNTNNIHDAIAAINHAHKVEGLPELDLSQQFYKMDPIQQQFIILNVERTIRGLRPLRMDDNLSKMAKAYSQQLSDLHFFAHTSPVGGTFSERTDRNAAVVNHYAVAAENLAGNAVPGVGAMYEYMYNDSIENCDHRLNVLNPELDTVGIGMVDDDTYGTISAQEFIASAPWNPYTGQAPNYTRPEVVIEQPQDSDHYSAVVKNGVGPLRLSWYLDDTDTPLQIGPSLTLDKNKLTPGTHTILAYAVDGGENYGVAKLTLKIDPPAQPPAHGDVGY